MTCHAAAVASSQDVMVLVLGLQAMTCTDIQEVFTFCSRQFASGCASAAGSLHRFRTSVGVAAAMLLCFTAVHLKMQSRHEQLVCFCASSRGTQRKEIV